MTLIAPLLRQGSRLYLRNTCRLSARTPVTVLASSAQQCCFHSSNPPVEDGTDAPVVEAGFWKEYKATFDAPRHDISFEEELQLGKIGKKVTAVGYLGTRRDLSGTLSFANLTDGIGRGRIQIISQRKLSKASDEADEVYRKIVPYSAVSVTGVLCQKEQPAKPGKAFKVPTAGKIRIEDVEIRLESIQCLNSFPRDIKVFSGQVYPAKSRHLQLRFDPQLKDVLRLRSEVAANIRKNLSEFQEIETPVLFKSTPEGANEFLVPSRKKGYAYALPQSPQQYKQMLMASGISRYLQFAKCFRDEDLRADRQPEFTQIDIEMAWATGEVVMRRVERLIKWLYEKQYVTRGGVLQLPVLDDHFRRMTYEEAMSQFGSDKPDLRFHGLIHRIDRICPADLRGMLTSIKDPIIEICKISLNDTPLNVQKFISKFMDSPDAEVFRQNPDGQPGIMVFDSSKPLEGLQVFGFEGTEKLKTFYSQRPTQTFDNYNHEVATTIDEGDLLLIQAREYKPHTGGSTALGSLRLAVYKAAITAGFLEPDPSHQYLWVTDFPLFTAEKSEDPGQGGTAGFSSTHHPFTAPKSAGDLELLLTDPLEAKADHYDLVVNGVELGGGSRRIHNAEMQKFVMKDILKMPESRLAEFEHLFEALRAGCPPHAGFAIGFDRLLAVMLRRDSIKDVIAFPKSSKGDDLFVKSPSLMTEDQLERYHLQLKSKPRKVDGVEEIEESSKNMNIEEPPSQA